MIYMDNAAAEQPLPAAIEAAALIWQRGWANPNSVHAEGIAARNALEAARETISNILNCRKEEIHFCSSACEAATWAIKSMYSVCYEIHCAGYEHECIIQAHRRAANSGPIWGHNRIGEISMLANNETGEIYKVPRGNILRFVDATAAVGQIPVDFRALGCDYLCGDALKFGGIPGAAFLIVKDGAPLLPLIYGNEERGGTPPVSLIVAMAAALTVRTMEMTKASKKTAQMRDYMIENLTKLPDAHLNGAWRPGDVTRRLPGNVNVSFAGIDGSALELMLSERGLMVSTGSACSDGKNRPSHVLLSMGVPPEQAKGTIRITLNETNTMKECKEAVRMIKECVFRLREL